MISTQIVILGCGKICLARVQHVLYFRSLRLLSFSGLPNNSFVGAGCIGGKGSVTSPVTSAFSSAASPSELLSPSFALEIQ